MPNKKENKYRRFNLLEERANRCAADWLEFCIGLSSVEKIATRHDLFSDLFKNEILIDPENSQKQIESLDEAKSYFNLILDEWTLELLTYQYEKIETVLNVIQSIQSYGKNDIEQVTQNVINCFCDYFETTYKKEIIPKKVLLKKAAEDSSIAFNLIKAIAEKKEDKSQLVEAENKFIDHLQHTLVINLDKAAKETYLKALAVELASLVFDTDSRIGISISNLFKTYLDIYENTNDGERKINIDAFTQRFTAELKSEKHTTKAKNKIEAFHESKWETFKDFCCFFLAALNGPTTIEREPIEFIQDFNRVTMTQHQDTVTYLLEEKQRGFQTPPRSPISSPKTTPRNNSLTASALLEAKSPRLDLLRQALSPRREASKRRSSLDTVTEVVVNNPRKRSLSAVSDHHTSIPSIHVIPADKLPVQSLSPSLDPADFSTVMVTSQAGGTHSNQSKHSLVKNSAKPPNNIWETRIKKGIYFSLVLLGLGLLVTFSPQITALLLGTALITGTIKLTLGIVGSVFISKSIITSTVCCVAGAGLMIKNLNRSNKLTLKNPIESKDKLKFITQSNQEKDSNIRHDIDKDKLKQKQSNWFYSLFHKANKTKNKESSHEKQHRY